MENLTKRIRQFNQDRIPKMTGMKYKAMSENIFRYFRGTNHLFYEDLKNSEGLPDSPRSWICGDLHLENFGSYRSDNRLVYFDLNDFDEAILAPAAWEAARLVTSIFVAFEALNIEQKRALKMARLFLKTYSAKLAEAKTDYIESQTANGIVQEFLLKASKRKQKEILAKKTGVLQNRLEILLDDPKHLGLKKKLKKQLLAHVSEWLKNDSHSPYNYRPVDAVFHLAGTGSIGLKRYAFLLKTLNREGEKYMLLDMKQAAPSSLAPYVGITQPEWPSEAVRIIEIEGRMQNRPPALLSTSEFRGESFVMQEIQPNEDSIDFKLIKKEYRNMYRVIDDMAMLTASSQLRSSGRQGSATADEFSSFGKQNDWQEKILRYAVGYSLQVKNDYADFLKDFEGGLLRKKNLVGL